MPVAEVHIQDGETLENALRRFKRKVLQEDIIKEIKRHSFYLKPGEKKRAKSALARKRNRKKRARDTAFDKPTWPDRRPAWPSASGAPSRAQGGQVCIASAGEGGRGEAIGAYEQAWREIMSATAQGS
jgi:small subunit ribosomal protein S21